MEHIVMELDRAESEINAYVESISLEREKLLTRLNEIDRDRERADEDLRRINAARNALRNPSEAQVMRDDVRAMAVAPEMAEAAQRARPVYYPGR